MRKLILVKHAKPQVVEGEPSSAWGLSAEGRASCGALAEVVRAHEPSAIVTSEEPKAVQTGELVGQALAIPVSTASGLAEHDRTNVPMMPPRDFISMMALFFRDRDRLVLGRETAAAALTRFRSAIDALLEQHPAGNLAVVTHGTVLALFAADRDAGDPFLLWRRMGLPSMLAFALPEFRVIELCEQVRARGEHPTAL